MKRVVRLDLILFLLDLYGVPFFVELHALIIRSPPDTFSLICIGLLAIYMTYRLGGT